MGLVYTETVSEIVVESAPLELGAVALLPMYENSTEYTGIFKYMITDPATLLETEALIELISYEGPSGFTAAETSTNSITISGVAQQVFIDAYYQFIMKDGTVQVLPANTEEPFAALISWSPPATKQTSITHTLKLLIKANPLIGGTDTEETFILEQEIYWKYGPALQTFQNLLSRGTL